MFALFVFRQLPFTSYLKWSREQWQPELPISCHDNAKNPIQTEDKVLPNTRAQALKTNCSICGSFQKEQSRMILRYLWKLYISAEQVECFSSKNCRRREGKGTSPQGTQPSAAGHISTSVHSNHKSAHSCIHMRTHLEFDLYFVISYKECMK